VASFPYANIAATGVMPRITLATAPLPWMKWDASQTPAAWVANVPAPMTLLQSQRMFVARDDLMVQVEGANRRTRPIVLYDGNLIRPFPYLYSDSIGDNAWGASSTSPSPHMPLQWLSEANYSWMVTLSPLPDESGQSYTNSQQYMLSIVVFYKRNLRYGAFDANTNTKPGERAIPNPNLGGNGGSLYFPDSGWGGGSVTVTVPAGIPADYLDVHANDWVLLMYTPNAGTPSICQWYQVLSASVMDPNTLSSPPQPGFGLGLTLAGADWKDPGITNAAKFNQAQNTTLVLVSGVVGVYSSTVQLDRGALYNRGPWKMQ
jgi:hypothetical protein